MVTTLNSTSGTVGNTVIDVQSIIDHAVRRCGVSAALLSAENQQSARENLFLILSDLATRGLSLWCVQRATFGVEPGLAEYTLPVGTVDVLNAFYRFGQTQYDDTSAGAGVVGLTLATADTITTVLVTPAAAGTYSLVLEYYDGSAWVQVGAATSVFGAYAVGVDASKTVSATQWRVRDTTDPTRVLSSAVFMATPTDIMMAKLSRDSYSTLPNKTFQANRSLQYWYDKQFYQPRIVLWPIPNQVSAINIYTQRQIQDPGAYTNAIEVPQRWLNTVISLLAPRVCLELPAKLVPPDRYSILKDEAASALLDAENSETDGAPIRLAPNISPYTR